MHLPDTQGRPMDVSREGTIDKSAVSCQSWTVNVRSAPYGPEAGAAVEENKP